MSAPDGQVRLATGLIIGIGGTGIEVLTRLKSFTRAERPDSARKSMLQFLEIDALPLEEQPNEDVKGQFSQGTDYFNLIDQSGFEPQGYLQGTLHLDPYLARWWGRDAKAPSGFVIDALRADRRLGRLAFYRRKDALTTAIQQAMKRALDIDFPEAAVGARGHELPVFVVASSCGGTGSSGFLEVLHSVYAAARLAGAGVSVKVRAVIFLPGVYRAGTISGPMGVQQVQQHNANAFGFFRELDHFMHRSGDFFADFDSGRASARVDAPDSVNRLVHQVFLMDATVGGIGTIEDYKDVYATTAEALYQLIMTDENTPLLGQAGTNYENVFDQFDIYGRPLNYCSLGVGTVLFPGDTYRSYLDNRFKDYVIRRFLIPNAPEQLAEAKTAGAADDEQGAVKPKEGVLEQSARADKAALTGVILDSIRTDLLDRLVANVPLSDEAIQLRRTGAGAAASLAATPDLETASRILNVVQELVSTGRVTASMRSSYAAAVDALTPEIDSAVVRPLVASGESIPFLHRVLLRVAKQLAGQVDTARANLASVSSRKSQLIDDNGLAGPQLQDQLDRLRDAAHRGVISRLFGRDQQEQQAAAADLGVSIGQYTELVIDALAREEGLVLLERVLARVQVLVSCLESAVERLQETATRLTRAWEADDLVGKDVGPRDTQKLLPSDVQPQVEDSALAVRVWAATERDFEEHHSGDGAYDLVAALYREWDARVPGGAFAVGSSDRIVSRDALAALDDLLTDLAAKEALVDEEGRTRFPIDLAAAAALEPGEGALERSLDELSRLAKGVFWSYDANRAKYQDAASPGEPVPSFIATGEAYDWLLDKWTANSVKVGPDPERAVAVVVQYAVPVHALREIPVWRDHYEKIRAASVVPDARGIKPPHISAEYYDRLTSLIPDYFNRDEVCLRIVKGLLLASVFALDEASALRSRRARSADVVPLDPTGYPGKPFVGREFVRDQSTGLLDAGLDTKDLGTTWSDLVQQLGGNFGVSEGIDVAWDAVTKAVSASVLVGAVEIFLSDQVPAYDSGYLDDASARALADVEAQARVLKSQLGQAVAREKLQARARALGDSDTESDPAS